jgi:hypothetical protein
MSQETKKGLFLLAIFLSARPSVFPVDISSKIHLWIFEVPAVQHIKIEEQRDGKPFTIIRGADLSNQFPDGGMVFNSPVLRTDTKRISDFLRTKLPENLLGSEVSLKCLLEEGDLVFDLNKNKVIPREVELEEEKKLLVSIELKKVIDSEHLVLGLDLKIKTGAELKNVVNSEWTWNTKKQFYAGMTSGLREPAKGAPNLKALKGNIYFIVLLKEDRAT